MKEEKKNHRFNKPVFVIFVYSGIKENVALLVHCFVSIMPTQKYFLMATAVASIYEEFLRENIKNEK